MGPGPGTGPGTGTGTGDLVSFEEWQEIRIAHDKEVEKLKELYARSPAAFWKYPSVGKCSERLRAYLDKTAEIRANDPFGVWS